MKITQEHINESLETKEYMDDLLEVSWLESEDMRGPGEWVVHRGSYIIVDGLEEQEAYNILDELQGICGE